MLICTAVSRKVPNRFASMKPRAMHGRQRQEAAAASENTRGESFIPKFCKLTGLSKQVHSQLSLMNSIHPILFNLFLPQLFVAFSSRHKLAIVKCAQLFLLYMHAACSCTTPRKGVCSFPIFASKVRRCLKKASAGCSITWRRLEVHLDAVRS